MDGRQQARGRKELRPYWSLPHRSMGNFPANRGSPLFADILSVKAVRTAGASLSVAPALPALRGKSTAVKDALRPPSFVASDRREWTAGSWSHVAHVLRSTVR
jgi:hypothetical protein